MAAPRTSQPAHARPDLLALPDDCLVLIRAAVPLVERH